MFVALYASARDQVDDGRSEGAQQKGPDKVAVEGATAKESARADDTPEYGAVEVHACERAGEAVDGLGRAQAGDVGEEPVEDADLGEGGDEGGDHLHCEEETGRDFHVVAEFEVRGEFDALGRGDVRVGDEDHVGDGAAGEEFPGDELADQVEGGVLIGDGHDDAGGDEEDGGDAEGEQDTVPGEVDGEVFDDEDAHDEHEDEGQQVPGHWSVGIASHQAAVDIFAAGYHVFVARLGEVG